MICRSTSRRSCSQAHSVEAVDKPVGTPDGIPWMRGPEWSLCPRNAITLYPIEFTTIEVLVLSLLTSYPAILPGSQSPLLHPRIEVGRSSLRSMRGVIPSSASPRVDIYLV